jgi:hypothetical protein
MSNHLLAKSVLVIHKIRRSNYSRRSRSGRSNPGEGPPYPFSSRLAGTPRTIRKLRRREKSLAPTKIRGLDRPVRNPVTVPNELHGIQYQISHLCMITDETEQLSTSCAHFSQYKECPTNGGRCYGCWLSATS